MKAAVLFLLVTAASAQPISFGIKAGLPATSAFHTGLGGTSGVGYTSDTKRYTLGPMVELNFPFGVGIEFDLLYKNLQYSQQSGVMLNAETSGHSWEFPLLLKYKRPGEVIRPFVSSGFSFNKLSGLKQVRNIVPGLQSGTPAELKNSGRVGLVLGGGIEIRLPVVKIGPELRFTRWGSESFSDVNGFLKSNQNQLDLLIGVRF